jgi:putative FmdB family regulatory protein
MYKKGKNMPTYEYECKACKHRFEEFLLIKDRENPTKNSCSECGKKEIVQGFFNAPVGGYDSNLKPQAGFSEIIDSIKNNGSVPKRYHDNLDRSANRTGARYKTQ